MGSVRRVCRNVKCWRDASMALRWTAAAVLEAAKGFRRLKAKRNLPALRTALIAHRAKATANAAIAQQPRDAQRHIRQRHPPCSTTDRTSPLVKSNWLRPAQSRGNRCRALQGGHRTQAARPQLVDPAERSRRNHRGVGPPDPDCEASLHSRWLTSRSRQGPRSGSLASVHQRPKSSLAVKPTISRIDLHRTRVNHIHMAFKAGMLSNRCEKPTDEANYTHG
jgi:hypothetical protein